MRVIMIGTDAKIVDARTAAHARMQEYARLVASLDIIVYTRSSTPIEESALQPNASLHIYPTQCGKLGFFLRAYQKGIEIVKERGTDETLVTTQDPFETGLVGFFLKMRFRLPLHVQVHTDFLSQHFVRESWKNRLRARFGLWLLARADRIRVVSERIRQSLLQHSPELRDRIDVLPIFVDEQAIAAAIPSRDVRAAYPHALPLLLVLSRLTQEKHIDLAVAALRALLPQYPRALLLIVGDGPEQKRLLRATEDIRDHVVFEPWNEDTISYFKAADVFLSSSWYEGYGRTLVEAHAAGVPIVTTDVGAAREVVQLPEEGRVVPVGDTDAFIRACGEVLRHAQKSTSLRQVQLPKEQFLAAYQQSWNATL